MIRIGQESKGYIDISVTTLYINENISIVLCVYIMSLI